MPEIKYLVIDNHLLNQTCYLLLCLAHQKDLQEAQSRPSLELPSKEQVSIAVFAVLKNIQESFGIEHKNMIEVLQDVMSAFNNAQNAVEGPKRT